MLFRSAFSSLQSPPRPPKKEGNPLPNYRTMSSTVLRHAGRSISRALAAEQQGFLPRSLGRTTPRLFSSDSFGRAEPIEVILLSYLLDPSLLATPHLKLVPSLDSWHQGEPYPSPSLLIIADILLASTALFCNAAMSL